MTTQDANAKGPGQGGRGRREGFSFGDDRKGRDGRDRDGRRGGRDGRDGRKGGGSSFRVVNELSTLEKALTKADFEAQRAPLQEVLKAVKPLHLKSVEDLDQNTRGRLITSLMKVSRQAKPKVEAAAEAPASEAAPVEASPAEAAPPTDGAPAAEAAPAAPAAPAVDPKVQAYGDALFTVGLIWRAVGDTERASNAFTLAGRQPTEAELAAAPREERPARPERSDRPGKGPRGERRDRKERSERPERLQHRSEMFVSSGDWQADAKKLEELGRTRDAGRIHEKHGSFADASRFFEAGGDLGSALRCAASAKSEERLQALMGKVKPEDVQRALERAEAWELLMAFHVQRQDYEAVARLYERARQFDQAAAAYEKSGKLSLARKAYEKVNDAAGAARVRDLEIGKLVERGDRFGAATLLVGAGKKAEALEVLKPLPPTKAFHFMEKLKLAAEAKDFGISELEKAKAAANPLHIARWYELLGEKGLAVDTYLAADRKDKAFPVLEAMGDFARAAPLAEASGQLDKAAELFKKAGDSANAERVAALPRPEPKPKVAAVTTEAVAAAAAAEAPSAPAPTAQA